MLDDNISINIERKKKIYFSTQQTYGEEDICHKHDAYLEIVVSFSSSVFLPASSKKKKSHNGPTLLLFIR